MHASAPHLPAGIPDDADAITMPSGHNDSWRSHLLAWAVANSVGLSVALAVPLWIGDFPGRVGLPPQTAGVAATVELMAAAAANILWALFSPRYPRRVVVACLSLGIGGASQLAASHTAIAAFAGLLIAGACSGCLLAVLNKQVAASSAPHHVYAALTFLHVSFGVFFFLAAPRIQAHFGISSLFQFLSGLAVLGAPFMTLLPSRPNALIAEARPRHAGFSVLGLIGLLALAILFMAGEAITAYVALLGQPLGLDRIQSSGVLALASAVGLAGAVLAGVLPARIGYALPICVTIAGMAAVDTVLFLTRDAMVFATDIVTLQILLVFATPRILGYLALIDPSGRSAGMGPAALLTGSSFGPLLAGLAGAPARVGDVPLASAACAVCAALLILIVGAARGRAHGAAVRVVSRPADLPRTFRP